MRILWWLVPLCVVLGGVAGAGMAAGEMGWLRGRPNMRDYSKAAREAASPELLPVHEPQPRVQIDETEYDFGQMEVDTKRSHAFTIRNVGKGPLTLKQGETTCKCTISELSDGVVPPGGETQVVLEWKAVAGNRFFRQQATIKTNDPKQRLIKLEVYGGIDEPIHLVPQGEVVFSSLLPNEEARDEILMLTSFDDRLEILDKKVSDAALEKFIEVEISPASAADLAAHRDHKAGLKIAVHVRPGLPLGRFRQVVELTTNVAAEPVKLPISGNVETGISIFGQGWNEQREILSFGTLPQGTGGVARLQIALKGDRRQDTQLKVGRVSPDFLQVELGERTQGEHTDRVPLVVTVPKDAPAATLVGTESAPLGEIDIETGHPDFPVMKLRVHLIVEG